MSENCIQYGTICLLHSTFPLQKKTWSQSYNILALFRFQDIGRHSETKKYSQHQSNLNREKDQCFFPFPVPNCRPWQSQQPAGVGAQSRCKLPPEKRPSVVSRLARLLDLILDNALKVKCALICFDDIWSQRTDVLSGCIKTIILSLNSPNICQAPQVGGNLTTGALSQN